MDEPFQFVSGIVVNTNPDYRFTDFYGPLQSYSSVSVIGPSFTEGQLSLPSPTLLTLDLADLTDMDVGGTSFNYFDKNGFINGLCRLGERATEA